MVRPFVGRRHAPQSPINVKEHHEKSRSCLAAVIGHCFTSRTQREINIADSANLSLRARTSTEGQTSYPATSSEICDYEHHRERRQRLQEPLNCRCHLLCSERTLWFVLRSSSSRISPTLFTGCYFILFILAIWSTYQKDSVAARRLRIVTILL